MSPAVDVEPRRLAASAEYKRFNRVYGTFVARGVPVGNTCYGRRRLHHTAVGGIRRFSLPPNAGHSRGGSVPRSKRTQIQ